MIHYEYWKTGKLECYFYSENNKMAKLLKKDFKKYGVYILNGRVCAWQFLIPIKLIPLIIGKFGKVNVDKSGLTDSQLLNCENNNVYI
jgi:hypothetical protein